MKIKILITFLCLTFLGLGQAMAKEHTQKDGLFSMDIPEDWHWVEYPEEIVIAYPDGQSVAIDIQLQPSIKLTPSEIRKTMQSSNAKMIKEGIEAHQGTLLDNKEIKLGGVYATQIDFKTSPPNSVWVTNISCFNKGYAITIAYGSTDEKIHEVMDDAVATFKF